MNPKHNQPSAHGGRHFAGWVNQPHSAPPPEPYAWEFSKTTARPFIQGQNLPVRVEVLRSPWKTPRVIVTPLALAKMHALVSAIDIEVGWLGTARRTEEGFVIDDVFLFRQTASSGHTEISPDALQDFASDVLQRPDGEDIFNNVRFWGHSHVNGSTWPSGQDDAQMKVFQEFGDDFFIRGILNRRGDINFGVYDWKAGVAFHMVPWTMVDDDLPEGIEQTIESLREEMQEKVVALRYAPPLIPRVASFLKGVFWDREPAAPPLGYFPEGSPGHLAQVTQKRPDGKGKPVNRKPPTHPKK